MVAPYLKVVSQTPPITIATPAIRPSVIVVCGAPNARAGRYTVAQCDRSNRAYPDALFERRFSGDYAFAFRCEEDEDCRSGEHCRLMCLGTCPGCPRGEDARVCVGPASNGDGASSARAGR